jgi:hypothetical protein
VRTDDSYDPAFGRVRRANSKRQRKQYDDQDTFAKRDRHVERLATGEDAADAPNGPAATSHQQPHSRSDLVARPSQSPAGLG